jgi:hypothetical protein
MVIILLTMFFAYFPYFKKLKEAYEITLLSVYQPLSIYIFSIRPVLYQMNVGNQFFP